MKWRWRVEKARKMIGSKAYVNIGDVVAQVESPQDGFVTVQTQDGEVGSLPENCLGKKKNINSCKVIQMFFFQH